MKNRHNGHKLPESFCNDVLSNEPVLAKLLDQTQRFTKQVH